MGVARLRGVVAHERITEGRPKTNGKCTPFGATDIVGTFSFMLPSHVIPLKIAGHKHINCPAPAL